MKRILIYTALVFVCCACSSGYDDALLAGYVERGILESVSLSFSDFAGSGRFIQKYALNDEELKMVGIWGFENIVCKIPNERKYGPGLTITFYPNRYFRCHKENQETGEIRSIFGEWKVVGKKLYVRFIGKLVIVEEIGLDKYKMYRGEYLNDTKFHKIFTVPDYKIAFVNEKAFDWGKIPLSVRSYFDFRNDDKPRSRFLKDSLAYIPGDLREGGRVGDLLFSPEIYDERYLIDLLGVW
jgi:hypothetical protein